MGAVLLFSQNSLLRDQNRLITEHNNKIDKQLKLLTDQNDKVDKQLELLTDQNTKIDNQLKLLSDQNTKIDQQTAVADAQKRGAFVTEMFSILQEVAKEAANKRKVAGAEAFKVSGEACSAYRRANVKRGSILLPESARQR